MLIRCRSWDETLARSSSSFLRMSSDVTKAAADGRMVMKWSTCCQYSQVSSNRGRSTNGKETERMVIVALIVLSVLQLDLHYSCFLTSILKWL